MSYSLKCIDEEEVNFAVVIVRYKEDKVDDFLMVKFEKIHKFIKIPHLDLFQNMIIAEVTTTTITIIISTKPVAVSVLRHRDDQVDP